MNPLRFASIGMAIAFFTLPGADAGVDRAEPGASGHPLVPAAFASPRLADAAATSTLPGAWEAVEYVLASGARHPVRGRIFFTEDEWQVLFFVMDGDEPRRGSGEGGRYTFDGETLTFEHLFHFSFGDAMEGLPASALEMTARDGEGPHEPTRVGMSEDALTLHFPSGNLMAFRRSSMP